MTKNKPIQENPKRIDKNRTIPKSFFYLLFVLLLYGILMIVSPEKTFRAVWIVIHILLKISIPLGLVVCLMAALNSWINPMRIAGAKKKKKGYSKWVLSVLAGIVSMGPVYAWYPLLKSLKEKGVSNGLIAVFIGCRGVKPIYIPIMVSFFGISYVLILTFFTLVGMLAGGYLVGVLVKE